MNTSKKHFLFLIVSYASIFISLSCEKGSESPVIARVGNSVLTVDDLNKSIPPEYSSQITIEQRVNYVKQWIDMELLYQEALRNKIDKEKDIRKRISKMKKDLLSSEILNRKSLQNKASAIDNNAIRLYYEQNKEQFRREHNLVNYDEIIVQDARIAWHITKNATPDNFLTFAAEYSLLQASENNEQKLIKLDSLPLELRNIISVTAPGNATAPVKIDTLYHVLLVKEKLEQGGICKEEEIRDEIVNRLSTKVQKENIDAFISDLRLKTEITFNSELLKNLNQTSDSTSPPRE